MPITIHIDALNPAPLNFVARIRVRGALPGEHVAIDVAIAYPGGAATSARTSVNTNPDGETTLLVPFDALHGGRASISATVAPIARAVPPVSATLEFDVQ